MKNTYIAVAILVLLVLGFWIIGRNKAEAPVVQTESETVTSGTPSIDAPVVKSFTITGKNFSYAPSLITVKKGDKIKLTFENVQGYHDIVLNGYGLATSQAQAPNTAVLEFIADKVGSFEFYCSVGTHKTLGMKGTLKVE